MSDRTYLNWPFFEPRHRELSAQLETWSAKHLAHVPHDELDRTCRTLVEQLGTDGWLRHAAPDPAQPGASYDVRTICLIRETMGRYSALAEFTFAMQGLGSSAIALAGTDAQKRAFLTGVRAGERIAAFALTEAESGSDLASVATTAVRDGDTFVLNGGKKWISNAGIADFYVVLARTGEAPGAKGLSLFVVEANTPGFRISERLSTIAPHPLGSLEFKECRVAADRLVGRAGDGFKITMAALDVFRTTVGAAALGFSRRALDEAVARTTSRQLFGAPLSAMQATQAKLADMAVAIDASALLVYRAAWTKDSGAERVTREASMAKYFSTESAQRVIDSAVQLCGALGVLSGHPVESLYREIRALRIYEGASEVQQQIIARAVLADTDQPRR
ncbi:MAG: acyl-CoA dehydrogenase [Opitutus sp.]|nr:acyl-CoA dehydrogenase [Opitutus sp.]